MSKTNYEYFKDEIIEILSKREGGCIAVVDNKPVNCGHCRCSKCDFHYLTGGCEYNRRAWLNAEHIEKPKLTKKERQFCELVETGWIARDANGGLYHASRKPYKEQGREEWTVPLNGDYAEFSYFGPKFSFIKWEDEEPWSVEELLKLEVYDE